MANTIILLPFLIFCFMFPLPTTFSNNKTDLLSLLAFKSAIDFDPYGALSSWNETTHFCRWKGIQCGRRHRDRVVAINLTSQGLMGSLSPHVSNLSFLRTIILQNNNFHGQIPREIGLLSRLAYVEFTNNSFIGAIPKNLSRCPNLVYLNLTNNELSGAIPMELGSMSKLQVLGLAFNRLSGPIPPFIGNITSLKRLSIRSGNFTGEIPESLSQLQKLEFLQLTENKLTGTVPSALFNLSATQFFAVSFNRLHGVLPSTMGLTLPNLKRFYLMENQFSGPIPASISNASLLEQIVGSSNCLTGPIPGVGRLAHLQNFVVESNSIADDISFISSFTNSSTELKGLRVGGNLLTGSLSDSIANLSTHLITLHIQKNKIHGNIPSGIGDLIGLTSLFLSDNYLEGPIPTGVAKLSNLREFDVGSNRFTSELPSSLGNLTFLYRLYLNGNNFSGNLPSSIGNCTDLVALDLSHNNFNGLIPPEILSLSSVSIAFNLSDNYFDGSIPYEVGSLINLGTLDLSNNRLSGSIPNSFAKCTSLQQLCLEGNSLEGEIPTGLSGLMGLQDLDLSRNNLSGLIPSFLGRMNLENLNLSFNRLQGEVPILGVFRNKTSISLDGNTKLCGGIWELKLPPCFSVKHQNKSLSNLLKILLPALAVVGICLMLLVFFTCKPRKSGKNETSSMASFSCLHFMKLTYVDLLKATNGFSEANLLGEGRFGSVYKGILDDGRTNIAVKVLNLFVRGASNSFMAECKALRYVRHRNLLKLLSICESVDLQGNAFKALIYDFKANGSLDKLLYDSRGEQNSKTKNLSMMQRLNIAIDIAQAIKYLHFGVDSSVVHGDLKPSNILLDHDMTAYVGDFGLAKIISDTVPSHESSTSVEIRGTIGYLAPEYATNNLISTQGDIYSYGILLLEMFTNKRPTDKVFTDHVNLPSFVSNALPDHVMDTVDLRILVEQDMNSKAKDCLVSILSIGVACTKTVPRDRMSIGDVVTEMSRIRASLLSSSRVELKS